MSPLRFGIVGGDAATLARVCTALAARAKQLVVPAVFPTYDALRAELANLELAWSPPIAAVQLEVEGRASMLVGVHREGGSSYSSAVFTAPSSKVRTVEELRGARIAWVDRESAAGYLVPRLKLASLGIRSFASESFEGSHDNVVRAVFEGRADAGATHVSYAPVRGNIESAGWTRAGQHDVRILATAGPIPPDVIVASSAIAELHERLTDALLSLASQEDVQALFDGRGFVLVGRYQYDQLRAWTRKT